MKEFQKRVVQEKAELDIKIVNLNLFITSDIFYSLIMDEKKRMELQWKTMMQYSKILGERISAFKS